MGEASPETLDALNDIVSQAVAAQEAGSAAGMADVNQALHSTVVSLSDSESLRKLVDRVLAEMRLVFHVMAPARDFHSHYVEHNVTLVAHLRAGKREEAAAGLRDHLNVAEAELLGLLPKS